ncbi:hypothetical protein PSPO01_03693 [Paraphaeosphaeria sporulosa]
MIAVNGFENVPLLRLALATRRVSGNVPEDEHENQKACDGHKVPLMLGLFSHVSTLTPKEPTRNVRGRKMKEARYPTLLNSYSEVGDYLGRRVELFDKAVVQPFETDLWRREPLLHFKIIEQLRYLSLEIAQDV